MKILDRGTNFLMSQRQWHEIADNIRSYLSRLDVDGLDFYRSINALQEEWVTASTCKTQQRYRARGTRQDFYKLLDECHQDYCDECRMRDWLSDSTVPSPCSVHLNGNCVIEWNVRLCEGCDREHHYSYDDVMWTNVFGDSSEFSKGKHVTFDKYILWDYFAADMHQMFNINMPKGVVEIIGEYCEQYVYSRKNISAARVFRLKSEMFWQTEGKRILNDQYAVPNDIFNEISKCLGSCEESVIDIAYQESNDIDNCNFK